MINANINLFKSTKTSSFPIQIMNTSLTVKKQGHDLSNHALMLRLNDFNQLNFDFISLTQFSILSFDCRG